jgi:anti-sigma regulatory factor (Ser/Thr protein kinase)
MATVEVTFTPLPVHVRTARLVATAVARRSGVAESLLDEVRLAVGEACSRAVEAHQRHCPTEPIRVSLTDDGEQFQVVVTDAAPGSERDLPAGTGLMAHGRPAGARAEGGNGHGPGADLVFSEESAAPRESTAPQESAVPLRLPDDVGLAVIAGLADDVRIGPAGPGTSVTMIWKRRTASY